MLEYGLILFEKNISTGFYYAIPQKLNLKQMLNLLQKRKQLKF